MRLRKKKFLEERIDVVNEILLVDNKLYIYDKPEEERFDLQNLAQSFGNDNPVHLEIGCGKGKFVCELAKQTPNINYIAVERVSNVIVSACERVKEEGLTNVRFVICMAENLYYYLPKGSISRIYLNFSCPYPKHTYANRRLTNERFLSVYKKFLAQNGEIFQKTDNRQLFEYSIETLSSNGFDLKNISLDLHSEENYAQLGNIITEYEKRFVEQGKPIYRLEATLKK